MKLLYTLVISFAFSQVYACNRVKGLYTAKEENIISKADSMKLKITIGEKTATAVLYDNPASKDFASLLPLTLQLEDYNNTEKVATLSKKLSTQSAPAGFDPSIGDLTYYAPWGNIALFYKDFGYSNGLVSMGKITSGIEAFTVKGPVSVEIALEK